MNGLEKDGVNPVHDGDQYGTNPYPIFSFWCGLGLETPSITKEKVKSASNKPTKLVLTRKVFLRKMGELIREFRLKKGFTQKQAADRCGCLPDLWKRYEAKGTESIRVLLKIAVSLDDSLSSMNKLIENKFPRQELSTFHLGGFQGAVKRNMDIREIETYLKKEDRIWVKEKLQALAWLAQGMKVKEVGKRLGLSQGLVQNWLGRYY